MEAPKKESPRSETSRLFHEFGDNLYRWALRHVKDEATAQDLIQETFISALQNYDRFKGQSSHKTWLFSILKNKLIDHHRKVSKLRFESLDAQKENHFNPFDEDGNWKSNSSPKDWGHADEHLLDDPEFEKTLSACLNALPALWSSCVHLKYLGKKESEAICQRLNISTSNLWQILHRAKLQLRNCLEQNWFSK